MPYVIDELKEMINPAIDEVVRKLDGLPPEKLDGLINYTLTMILNRGIADDNKSGEMQLNWNYYRINRAKGTLGSVYDEFNTRVAVPYEKRAEGRNGDISVYAGLFE